MSTSVGGPFPTAVVAVTLTSYDLSPSRLAKLYVTLSSLRFGAIRVSVMKFSAWSGDPGVSWYSMM